MSRNGVKGEYQFTFTQEETSFSYELLYIDFLMSLVIRKNETLHKIKVRKLFNTFRLEPT